MHQITNESIALPVLTPTNDDRNSLIGNYTANAVIDFNASPYQHGNAFAIDNAVYTFLITNNLASSTGTYAIKRYASSTNTYEDISYGDTRIISLIPESNTTIIPFVATTTDRFADFDVDLLTYFNNTSDLIYVINTYLTNNNIPSYHYSTSTISGFVTGVSTSSYNIAHSVPFGNYDLSVNLLDSNLNIISATTSYNITFGSSTNAITFSDVYGASSSNMFDIGQIATSSNCSILDLTGCVKNAIVWAFFPTQEAISGYSSFLGAIQTKAPIGYFYMIKNAITDINASSTSAFNITIPQHIKIYFISPIDIGISGILWIYFLFMFYKRLKHIQI